MALDVFYDRKEEYPKMWSNILSKHLPFIIKYNLVMIEPSADESLAGFDEARVEVCYFYFSTINLFLSFNEEHFIVTYIQLSKLSSFGIGLFLDSKIRTVKVNYLILFCY